MLHDSLSISVCQCSLFSVRLLVVVSSVYDAQHSNLLQFGWCCDFLKRFFLVCPYYLTLDMLFTTWNIHPLNLMKTESNCYHDDYGISYTHSLSLSMLFHRFRVFQCCSLLSDIFQDKKRFFEHAVFSSKWCKWENHQLDKNSVLLSLPFETVRLLKSWNSSQIYGKVKEERKNQSRVNTEQSNEIINQLKFDWVGRKDFLLIASLFHWNLKH